MKKKRELMTFISILLSLIGVVCSVFSLFYGERMIGIAKENKIVLYYLLLLMTIPIGYLYFTILFKRVVHSRYVYISFCKADKPLAIKVKEILGVSLNKYSRYRYEILTGDDDIQYGDDMPKSVVELIQKSRAVIVIVSPDYINSKWCQLEFNSFDFAKQRIIPIIVDDRQKRDYSILEELPYDMSNIKGLCIDSNATESDLERNLSIIAKSIIRDSSK